MQTNKTEITRDKQRTAPILSLEGQFNMYEGLKVVKEGVYTNEYVCPVTGDDFVITSGYPLEPRDGVMSGVIMSRCLQYSDNKGKFNEGSNIVSVTMEDLLTDMKLTDRYENRDSIYNTLDHLRTFSLIGRRSKPEPVVFNLSMFAGLEYNLATDSFRIEVGSLFVEMFMKPDKEKHLSSVRMVNTETPTLFKSQRTVTLNKYLEVNGQGLYKDGTVNYKKSVTKSELVKYMKLEEENPKATTQIIGRAFKELEQVVGVKYKYHRRTLGYIQEDFKAFNVKKKKVKHIVPPTSFEDESCDQQSSEESLTRYKSETLATTIPISKPKVVNNISKGVVITEEIITPPKPMSMMSREEIAKAMLDTNGNDY